MVQILCFSWLPMLSLLEEIHQAREINRYVAPVGFKALLLLGDHRFIEKKTYWMYEQNDEFMQQWTNVYAKCRM